MGMVNSSKNDAPDPSNDFSDSDSDAAASPRPKQDADFNVFAACAEASDVLNKQQDAEDALPNTEANNAVETNTGGLPSSDDLDKKRYVTPQDFELLKVIGMGAFGKVLQVKSKSSQQVLAMKVISKRLLKHKTSYVENIHAERDILTKVRHPFIVAMHCSFQTREKLFIIMDFLAGGELFLRLGREGIFMESTAKFYVGEIVLALEHLHSRGILHRDLKPENILLASDGHLCLTDFGLSKDFRWDDVDEQREDGRTLTICGTYEYMAPEMLASKGYTKAADWWSLGCIVYEMLAGEAPFQSKKGAKDLIRKIMNERVRMPDGSSAAACILLKGLLNRDATARFGATKGTMLQVGGTTQVKQLAFFSGLDWTLLAQKEIDPPLTAHVDNDEDLRHFYDEFTSMSLPRSVQEMSKEDFRPQQCKSDAFRGFSFIQHDFDLPDRTNEQDYHYWNNIEEDGESASECASMMNDGDDDDDERATAQMKPTLDSTPEGSETPIKKRAPRKKKKKGGVNAVTNLTTPPPDAIELQTNPIASTPTSAAEASTGTKTVSIDQAMGEKIDISSPKEPKKADPPKLESVSKQKHAQKAPTWETVNTLNDKKKVQGKTWGASPIKAAAMPVQRISAGNSLKPTATPWAPSQFNGPSTPGLPGQWAKNTPQAAPTVRNAAAPPSDWRDHKLQTNIIDRTLPSLGDFPAHFPTLGGSKAEKLAIPQSSGKKQSGHGSWSKPVSTNGTSNAWAAKR